MSEKISLDSSALFTYFLYKKESAVKKWQALCRI